MSQATFTVAPFTTTVKLWLLFQDKQIPLAEAGPDYIRARQPLDIPAGSECILIISVDGEQMPHHVILPDGMSAAHPEAAIVSAVAPY